MGNNVRNVIFLKIIFLKVIFPLQVFSRPPQNQTKKKNQKASFTTGLLPMRCEIHGIQGPQNKINGSYKHETNQST